MCKKRSKIKPDIALLVLGLLLASCQTSPLSKGTGGPAATTVPGSAATGITVPTLAQPTEAVPAASPTSPVVIGSIRIGEGENVDSGTTGQPLQVTVHFAASSSAGPVTQMREARIPACSADISNTAAWEPFAPEKVFTIPNLPAGITAFDVSVQYRDSQGNVSLFYCEDGAIEGDQSPPTP